MLSSHGLVQGVNYIKYMNKAKIMYRPIMYVSWGNYFAISDVHEACNVFIKTLFIIIKNNVNEYFTSIGVKLVSNTITRS